MNISTSNPNTINQILAAISALPKRDQRQMIAIAGPPGAGKSTLAEAVVTKLSEQGQNAALLSMDGFHLDNRILEKHGTLERKGSPETFDFAGFENMLGRLQKEKTIYLPIFDRDRELAIAGSVELSPETEIIVVEGNYLLLDEEHWRDLKLFWDLSIFLNPPLPILEERLTKRWLGYNYTPKTLAEKLNVNDLPNVRRVKQFVLQHDLEFED